MPLLDTPPATLCHSVLEAFHIQSDIERLATINENAQTLQKLRKTELDETRAALRSLSRSLDAAKSSVEASLAVAAKREHAKTILDLDKQKFALAKNVTELEKSNHLMEANLAKMKDEYEGLDLESPMQSNTALSEDETILRLKIYRSFGIELKEDGAGGYSSAIINKKDQGDVAMIKLDSRLKRSTYTDFFWDAI
ncbi:kinetochore-associated Ndc80 complex subunit spc24 [Arthrobotrys conoides]|uniref:Kinetochore protein Spc24 n=1 Tax=Arthrobotrys conoides TaxID=74498 RepID=A0AAN8NCY3_9PEZI